MDTIRDIWKGFDLIQNSNSSNPSSSVPPSWKYDVFLSFRGPDTRKSFTDHLRHALIRQGIRVYRDDEQLVRGYEYRRQLLLAIESSRVSIIIFSGDYANSSSCLDELVKILDCSKQKGGSEVIPIFYGVDPADVRRHFGNYGEALVQRGHNGGSVSERHRLKIQRWREALTHASYLSGRHLKDSYETKFISEIIKDVLLLICTRMLHVADHPVSVETRRDEISSIHDSTASSDDVRIIGIYGMGGIGKTVIAKSLYNHHVLKFDYSCFLANVREISKGQMGLVRLQNQLLSSMHVQNVDKNNYNVDAGRNLIRQRCCTEKMLLVIDDANELEQVKCFVGERSWFGSGSRIIITTRDKELLDRIIVDEAHQANVLSVRESIDLFSWHAFNAIEPPDHFRDMAGKMIDYAGGLPLALEILGSYLLGKPVEEWKSCIAKLQKIPHRSIQKTLKISFKTLEDDHVKNIFLYIACFLIGMDKHYVTDILDGCGYDTIIGISSLKFKCLLTIDTNDRLRMHDLVRDMGREIVRKEFPEEPGKRSRLWFHDDAYDVLKNVKGSESVKGISIIQPSNEKLNVPVEAFEKMPNLRLLQMENVSITQSTTALFKELRWICWSYCSLKHLPQKMCLQNVVILDMQHSQIRNLWGGTLELPRLKTLNLSHSIFLEKTPDLTGSRGLENILLEGCKNLHMVHKSIGDLVVLSNLNLKNCVKLSRLPTNVYTLQGLNVVGCIKLKREPAEPWSFSDSLFAAICTIL